MICTSKVLVIALLLQFNMLFHAYGKVPNEGPNGFVAKLGKDAKLSQRFENGPSNTQERPTDDGKNLEVVTFAFLRWLMNDPAFANKIHQLTRNKHLSRQSLINSRPYLNEKLLFRMKKVMEKPHAMLLRIGRQA